MKKKLINKNNLREKMSYQNWLIKRKIQMSQLKWQTRWILKLKSHWVCILFWKNNVDRERLSGEQKSSFKNFKIFS